MARYFQPVNAINAVNATSVPTFGTSLVEQESHLIVTHLEFDPKGAYSGSTWTLIPATLGHRSSNTWKVFRGYSDTVPGSLGQLVIV